MTTPKEAMQLIRLSTYDRQCDTVFAQAIIEFASRLDAIEKEVSTLNDKRFNSHMKNRMNNLEVAMTNFSDLKEQVKQLWARAKNMQTEINMLRGGVSAGEPSPSSPLTKEIMDEAFDKIANLAKEQADPNYDWSQTYGVHLEPKPSSPNWMTKEEALSLLDKPIPPGMSPKAAEMLYAELEQKRAKNVQMQYDDDVMQKLRKAHGEPKPSSPHIHIGPIRCSTCANPADRTVDGQILCNECCAKPRPIDGNPELAPATKQVDLPEDLIQAFIDFDHLLARQFGLGLAEVAVRGGLYKITRTTELMGPTGSITVSSEPR